MKWLYSSFLFAYAWLIPYLAGRHADGLGVWLLAVALLYGVTLGAGVIVWKRWATA